MPDRERPRQPSHRSKARPHSVRVILRSNRVENITNTRTIAGVVADGKKLV
jgi:hypothetical protein